MKNLLQKSLRPLTIFAFIVFTLSIPTYFLLVDWIWLKELDENNNLIAQRIENEFNGQQISNEKLEESIGFWNEIQSLGRIEPILHSFPEDTIYTVHRQNPYSEKEAIDRFRGLITNIEINNKKFALTIETNVEETEETVAYIAIVSLFFFLILVIGFWVLNKIFSEKLWNPFQDTLQKLKSFELNKHTEMHFIETDIIEFKELNTALDKLLQQSIATYKSQKEFTENASHELQTPLAIIKNKLDLLLQKEDLTDRQYQIIEEINKVLTRVSRINKNLLLLAKIENHQFEDNETINLTELTNQCLKQLEEHFEIKKLRVHTEIKNGLFKIGNKILIEILLNNLFLNSIRHNSQKGEIAISLDKSTLTITNSGTMSLNAENLFKRFKKVSNQRSGSGLGLAIVEQICKRHNWNINYQFQNEMHIFKVRF